MFFISLGILFSGFFVANGSLLGVKQLEQVDPGIYALAMPLVLMFGFTSTLISVRLTNLWIRQPRPEATIQANLKGLSNKSALYNYYHFPARHVLVCPNGIFSIITRFQDGKFSFKNNRWRTHRNPISQLFSIFRMDGIGNPGREAQDAANYIQSIVQDYDPELAVRPVILFVDPRVSLELEATDIAILYGDPKQEPNLKSYLKEVGKDDKLADPKDLAEFIREFEYATILEDEEEFEPGSNQD